ncbi:lysosomal-associated transmembrane protein 4B-like [Schistocerca piceifrons]|uniref:lysosomal-associated transmembrane protein 4B-like n=1 Tax=Schistocerca piceifrons TaxID=274613 RepID=UPI001F5F7701|nr:lysosomal-associated transmembrane protein 4B-like [Schistocerca piceifrons]
MSTGVLFKSCCCGCTLKTGTILIALWYQAASVVQLATMAYRWETGDYMGGSNDQTLQRVFDPEEANLLRRPYLNSLEIMYTYPLLIISLMMNVFEVVSCAMLLYGAMKERYGFVLPWMIIETLIVASSSVVMVQVSSAFLSDKEFYAAGIVGLLFCCAFVVVNGYLILVVYSFYRSLRMQLSSKQLLINEEAPEEKEKEKEQEQEKEKPKTGLDAVVFTRPVLHLGGKDNYSSLSEA